jgi:hypothetical protein
MLDAVAASTKAAEMDEGAAGAVQQAVNRAVEAIGVGRIDAANPVRIEQLAFVKRAIIRINDRTGPPFARAADRDLDHPGAHFAEARAVQAKHRAWCVAPAIVVDSRHAEFKSREGAGEGRDEVVVSRGRSRSARTASIEAASGRPRGEAFIDN